eukprot:6208763-Pleurochrysis_carterae.AAC.2
MMRVDWGMLARPARIGLTALDLLAMKYVYASMDTKRNVQADRQHLYPTSFEASNALTTVYTGRRLFILFIRARNARCERQEQNWMPENLPPCFSKEVSLKQRCTQSPDAKADAPMDDMAAAANILRNATFVDSDGFALHRRLRSVMLRQDSGVLKHHSDTAGPSCRVGRGCWVAASSLLLLRPYGQFGSHGLAQRSLLELARCLGEGKAVCAFARAGRKHSANAAPAARCLIEARARAGQSVGR